MSLLTDLIAINRQTSGARCAALKAQLDNYDYICEFSAMVKSKVFETTIPPCQLKTFDKLMDAFEENLRLQTWQNTLPFSLRQRP